VTVGWPSRGTAAWLLITALVLIGRAAGAQAAPIRQGEVIRVTPACAATSREPACRPVQGHFIRRQGDSLVIQGYRERPYVVAVEPGTRLELSSGRRHHTLLGLGAGTAVGIGAGAIISEGCKSGGSGHGNCELAYLLTVPLGALVGTVVGAAISTPQWRPLIMTGVGGPASRPAVAVGLAVHF
jgi:hypothetical protein